MAKNCELCQKEIATKEKFGVKLCEECHNGFDDILKGKREAWIAYSDESKFPNATDRALREIVGLAKRKLPHKTAEEKEQERIEHEIRRQDFAKSFNEFYEYDVVTIINENHGTVDKEKMMRILSDYAKRGWKLHTMYSNELGKNALMILGFGSNSTACEDVLIFERRIADFD